MYKPHRDFYTPEDSTVIWHYFSLSKFIGLLESSELFFSRQDQFDDRGEGRLSQLDRSFLLRHSGSIAEHLEGDQHGCFYANCWTMSESDEYVLWNTYASLEDGIAVKSTVRRIIRALDEKDERAVYIARVEYYDEITGSTFNASGGIVNQLALAFSKRKYFIAEKELRLLYRDNNAHLDDNSTRSASFYVDLRELIESVYVAPKSYMWFKDAVAHLISLYGLTGVHVHKSRI